MSKKRYKLTNDLLFKAVFGRDEEPSKQLLMHLLNALLERKGTEKITAIEHKNPFSIREKEDEKEVIFDIKVKLMNGQYVDIEMQVNAGKIYRKRSLFYWSKLHSEQEMRGNDYVEVHKSICINIVDSLCIYESEKNHNVFKVLEVNEHFLLDDDLEIHYFQLPKIHDIIMTDEGYKSWMFFIKNLGDQEQDEMINELVEREDVFKMAYEEYSKISADDLVRERIEAHEKYLMDQRTRERIAHEEGIEQGVNKTKIEMVQKALEKGLSIEDIADLTGLSVEEIKQIGHAHT